jgi:molecular chaperone GrpE
VSIPVKVVRSTDYQTWPQVEKAHDVTRGAAQDPGRKAIEEPQTDEKAVMPAPGVQDGLAESREQALRPEANVDEWRDLALRLQAEMNNYRKRQQRLAQEQIEAERHRLLGAYLQVVDDLERALAAPKSDGDGLRRGVELTHRAAVQLLQKEGIEAIEAENHPFDPNWHEAVATIERSREMAPNMVVQVMEPGYRLEDRLLRPAKVVVAL